MPAAAGPGFLRIPPFPGARPRTGGTAGVVGDDAATLADAIVRLRVGGAFWDRQPALPSGRDVILVPSSAAMAAEMMAAMHATGLSDRAVAVAPAKWVGTAIPCVAGPADPWHLAAHASAVWTDGDDDLALVAALCDCPVRPFGPGRFAALGDMPDRDTVLRCLAGALRDVPCNPFTGAAWPVAEAIAQLGAWRALIDENRLPARIYGIARWKRETMDALLWDGSGPVRHTRSARAAAPGETVLAWTSRVPAATISGLAARDVRVGEIEDGMIRSQGLGANCVPPLSVVVDREGVHFDPSCPNTLERMLADADFAPDLLERAAALRTRLIGAGLSKYGAAPPVPATVRTTAARHRILVPGQVEDDRSVLAGGGGLTNLALLQRTRALEPHAHITYRPHPDVEAGHRKGRLADRDVHALADAVERGGAVTAAIDAADALHVITSLAGFEALMRGKAVTAHGVPFYAGWGLTTDLATVPARRGRPRTLDELVAAVLILYPRYLDPVTRLPCPVELLVDRLARGEATISSPLIVLRQWQGAFARLRRRRSPAR